MVSENDRNDQTQPDNVDEVLEQIRRRGETLLDEFEKARSQDLDSVLPDLIALREGQDKILELLEKIRDEN